MAVGSFWIKNSVIALSAILLLFVLVQIALTAVANVINLGIYVHLNSAIEYACLASFITPAVWLGFAAAMSRHRGVYITLTVIIALSVLSSIGLIVYEGYVFGSMLLFYTSASTGLVQGIMISKLIIWSVITVTLLVLLGLAIAGDSSRSRPEFKYYNGPGQGLPGYSSMPPEYASRPVKAKPYEPARDYPRLAGPAPVRYSEYTSPRAYYSKY